MAPELDRLVQSAPFSSRLDQQKGERLVFDWWDMACNNYEAFQSSSTRLQAKIDSRINARYKWRPIKVNKLLLWQAVSCLAVWSGSINSSREENRTEKKLYPTRVFAQQLSTEHRHQQQKKNIKAISTYKTSPRLITHKISTFIHRHERNIFPQSHKLDDEWYGNNQDTRSEGKTWEATIKKL